MILSLFLMLTVECDGALKRKITLTFRQGREKISYKLVESRKKRFILSAKNNRGGRRKILLPKEDAEYLFAKAAEFPSENNTTRRCKSTWVSLKAVVSRQLRVKAADCLSGGEGAIRSKALGLSRLMDYAFIRKDRAKKSRKR